MSPKCYFKYLINIFVLWLNDVFNLETACFPCDTCNKCMYHDTACKDINHIEARAENAVS